MSAVQRTFVDSQAVRGSTPMLFGLIGPSGSGKTYSALRLATGFQHVFGGETFVIDTEASRAKHYAELFRFRHVPFAAPFSPDDYIAAIKHCVAKGAKTIVIDSLSHEHSGQGGVLEWHAAEVERIMAAWRCNEDKANIPAWGKPKAARRRLINEITQANCNVIACFRAKDKIKVGGGKVIQMGWMPDAGEEFVFELTGKALLLPGAGGVPTWQSDQIGEKTMIKLPEYLRGIFSGAAGKPLDESIGQQLAKWAAGSDQAASPPPTAADYDACTDQTAFDALEKRRADVWKAMPPDAKAALKKAADATKARLATDAFAAPTTNTQADPVGEQRQPYTEQSALAHIREQNSPEAVDAIVTVVRRDYEARGETLPLSIEPAATDRKEALHQY